LATLPVANRLSLFEDWQEITIARWLGTRNRRQRELLVADPQYAMRPARLSPPDGGKQRNLIILPNGGVESLQESDVPPVQQHIDRTSQIPVLVKELFLEDRVFCNKSI